MASANRSRGPGQNTNELLALLNADLVYTYSDKNKSQLALKKFHAKGRPIVFLDIVTITETASCRLISFASIDISKYLKVCNK